MSTTDKNQLGKTYNFSKSNPVVEISSKQVTTGTKNDKPPVKPKEIKRQ